MASSWRARASAPALFAAVSPCLRFRDLMSGEAMGREILRGLPTDSFVGPDDQGDEFVLHSNPFLLQAHISF